MQPWQKFFTTLNSPLHPHHNHGHKDHTPQAGPHSPGHSETVEPTGTTWQKFSKEGFVDAVVEWIVADDQVHI